MYFVVVSPDQPIVARVTGCNAVLGKFLICSRRDLTALAKNCFQWVSCHKMEHGSIFVGKHYNNYLHWVSCHKMEHGSILLVNTNSYVCL